MENILMFASKTYNYDQAMEEASRCLLCEDPPCESGCPSKVPVKEFIRNIRFGNLRGAYHIIKVNNVFGASCARICNSSTTCKKFCTSEKLVRPIEIDKLQQFVCDAFVGDEPSINIEKKKGKKVAVLGGGPSGLSTAYELYRNGIDVDLFEREKFLGGMLYSGIPSYRLPLDIVKKETSWIEDLGVNCIKGKNPPTIEALKSDYDALVIAVGLNKSVLPEIPGANLNGTFLAKHLLRAHKLNEDIKIGDNVVIIGGGNSALDAAAVCKERGVNDVTILYRRTEAEMPAWAKEKKVAKELGVNIRFLTVVTELKGKGRVEELVCQLMELTNRSGSDGRRGVLPIKDAYFTLKTDTVIFGVGELVDSDFFKSNNIKLKPFSHETNLPNVYCTGDIVSDEKTVVHCVANGRTCASKVLDSFNIECKKIPKKNYYGKKAINLKTNFCGVEFENPFILAAAPPSDDLEMVRDAFNKGWAGAVLKTTSIESNSVPLKYPMMSGIKFSNKNLMGLGNIDLISEHHIDVVEERVKILKKEFPNKVVIASIMGAKKEDWQSLVKRLERAGVDIIECSFSCPQGTLGSKPGFMLGQDPKLVKEVAGWIKGASKKVPIVIKITPQVTDIVEIATAVKESGADAICASNSIPSLMGIDLESFIPYPNVGGKSTYSGYTGAAIKPITLRNIAEIKRNVDIPITGTGGPVNWRDSVEIMSVGASNVQFCTAVMHYGFDLIDDLCGGLAYYMEKQNINSVSELIGRALPAITTHDELIQAKRVVSNINEETCIGCGDCYVACRDGGHRAIIFNNEKRKAKTDEDKCVGCAFCEGVCPIKNCIQMKELFV